MFKAELPHGGFLLYDNVERVISHEVKKREDAGQEKYMYVFRRNNIGVVGGHPVDGVALDPTGPLPKHRGGFPRDNRPV
jgi:hypothetical protein